VATSRSTAVESLVLRDVASVCADLYGAPVWLLADASGGAARGRRQTGPSIGHPDQVVVGGRRDDRPLRGPPVPVVRCNRHGGGAAMTVRSATRAAPDAVRGDRSDLRPGPAELAEALEALRDEMRRRHLASRAVFAGVHRAHERSARNLVDYLMLRSHDMCPLRAELADLGVSSLGRAEEHVLHSVESVIGVLHALSGDCDRRRTEAAVDLEEGRRSLQANAVGLLGPGPSERATRIMVTMPTEAADDGRSSAGFSTTAWTAPASTVRTTDPGYGSAWW
jgi:hypothetical protein